MPGTELLKKMLTLDEGKRNKAYKDSEGIWTIGIGRNLEDPGLSEAEITFLFENDITKRLCDSRMQSIMTGLDEVRKSVLVDMSFMGIRKLMGFKNMIAALEAGDYDTAAREMLDSKWATQVGPRAPRLAYMMKTGNIHRDYL